jgi:hypothetical protein
MEKEDLTGKKFNRLMVVNLSHKDKYSYYWNCVCECGNLKTERGARLKNGQTKSCGCLKMKVKMDKIMSLIGQQYNRLKVISFVEEIKGIPYYKCLCDCGTIKNVNGRCLVDGQSKSCGCLNRENVSKKFTKHGLYKTREYSSWNAMMQRCYNPKQDNYPNYGGRGIEVCERWHDVTNFYADMGERPEETSLDRIDNNGNYEPGNVRWSTDIDQHNNTNRNIKIPYNGESKTVAQWSVELGIKARNIHKRLKRGYDIKDVLYVGHFKTHDSPKKDGLRKERDKGNKLKYA